MRSILLSSLLLIALSAPAWGQAPPEQAFELPLKGQPVSAVARAQLSLHLEKVLPEQRAVQLRFSSPQPERPLRLELNGQPLPLTAEPRITVPLNPQESAYLKLSQLNAEGEVEHSTSLELDPRQWAPRQYQWSLQPHQVVGEQLNNLLIQAPDYPNQPAQLQLELDGQPVYATEVQPGQQLLVPPLSLSTGSHQLRYRVSNAWGSSVSAESTVHYLGVEPPAETFVLVDKYQFSLYWVEKGKLKKIYPVATGRPRTPTPTGKFIVGLREVMHPPTTDWGARRMRIYRPEQYPHHWSGYAIHGTNRPSSIGTEASHGCLRMFNSDVIELFQQLPTGTPVIIEEKSKVDIDKVRAPASEK